MCEYCEKAFYKNDYGREFGKFFPENTYETDIQILWKEDKTDYNIYANNDNLAYDVSFLYRFIFALCVEKNLIRHLGL